jgi:hypothetical protein
VFRCSPNRHLRGVPRPSARDNGPPFRGAAALARSRTIAARPSSPASRTWPPVSSSSTRSVSRAAAATDSPMGSVTGKYLFDDDKYVFSILPKQQRARSDFRLILYVVNYGRVGKYNMRKSKRYSSRNSSSMNSCLCVTSSSASTGIDTGRVDGVAALDHGAEGMRVVSDDGRRERLSRPFGALGRNAQPVQSLPDGPLSRAHVSRADKPDERSERQIRRHAFGDLGGKL